MPSRTPYIKLISLSHHHALVAFNLPRMSTVTVESLTPKNAILAETAEQSAIGRINLDNLQSGADYTVRVKWSNGDKTLTFTTLPKPVGRLRASYAVIADPHISEKNENRKGRLFVESHSILRDIADQINAMKLDFVLLAGDITNKAAPAEFAAAKSILDQLNCPYFAAPGDHDIDANSPGRWRKTFGDTESCHEIKGLAVIAVDTHTRKLSAASAELIRQALTQKSTPLIVVSHLQLIPDDYIRFGKTKTITNADGHRELLDELLAHSAIIYAGHQNVPSTIADDAALQVNLPQPVQFPCGYLIVRQFANGFYHNFQPIASEALNQYSRLAGNQAARTLGEKQWTDRYRVGKDIGQSNFLFTP